MRPAVVRSHHEDVDREDNEPIDDIDSPTEAFDESTLTIKKPLRGNIVGMNHYLGITNAYSFIITFCCFCSRCLAESNKKTITYRW